MAWKLRKRWLALTAVVAVVLLLIFLIPRRFGKEQFDRIELGMTLSEVVAILGCPPDDYRSEIWRNPTWYTFRDPIAGRIAERGLSSQELDRLQRKDVDDWVKAGKPIPPPIPPPVTMADWRGRAFGIKVGFDANGQVIHVSHWEMWRPRSPPDLWTKIRWRFGW